MVPTNHLKRYLLKEIGDFPACHVGFSGGVKDTNYFLGNDPFFSDILVTRGLNPSIGEDKGSIFLKFVFLVRFFGSTIRTNRYIGKSTLKIDR